MFTKAYLVKGTAQKVITADKAIDLIRDYSIVGFTYNKYGQVIYLASKKGQRVHSILLMNQ